MVQGDLAGAQRSLLSELATLIAQGGAWRFLHGSVVAANEADYPDAWDESRAAVARVIARTLWHARVPFDATLEDARVPGAQREAMLRNTLLGLASIDGHGARFRLHHIGNDDVAGIVAHEVGRAFVGWLARDGHPFRTAADDGLPEPAIGSLATVYLGLGVVAANAAYHPRARGELRGNSSRHSHWIGRAGGLDVDDLAFLLAVQDVVRDDVVPAFGSLRPPQAAAMSAWSAVLEDREDELRALLGLNDASSHAPGRPLAPRPVPVDAAVDETQLYLPNHGKPVFRVPQTRRGRPVAGWMLGVAGGGIASLALVAGRPGPEVAIMLGGGAIGFAIGRALGGTRVKYRCATCESFVAAADVQCPNCGGTFAGDIAHRGLRLEAEDALEASADAAGEPDHRVA